MTRCPICGEHYAFYGHICPGQRQTIRLLQEQAKESEGGSSNLASVMAAHTSAVEQIGRQQLSAIEEAAEQNRALVSDLNEVTGQGLKQIDFSIRTLGEMIGFGFGAFSDLVSGMHSISMQELRRQTGLLEDIVRQGSNPRQVKADEWLREGSSFVAIDDPKGALSRFDSGICEYEGDFRLHFYRGLCLAKLGRNDEAIDAYRAAIKFLGFPEYSIVMAVQRSIAWTAISRLYFITDRYSQSIDAAIEALSCNPKNAEAAYSCATAMIPDGRNTDMIDSAAWYLNYAVCVEPGYALRLATDAHFVPVREYLAPLVSMWDVVRDYWFLDARIQNECAIQKRSASLARSSAQWISSAVDGLGHLLERLREGEAWIARLRGGKAPEHATPAIDELSALISAELDSSCTDLARIEQLVKDSERASSEASSLKSTILAFCRLSDDKTVCLPDWLASCEPANSLSFGRATNRLPRVGDIAGVVQDAAKRLVPVIDSLQNCSGQMGHFVERLRSTESVVRKAHLSVEPLRKRVLSDLVLLREGCDKARRELISKREETQRQTVARKKDWWLMPAAGSVLGFVVGLGGCIKRVAPLTRPANESLSEAYGSGVWLLVLGAVVGALLGAVAFAMYDSIVVSSGKNDGATATGNGNVNSEQGLTRQLSELSRLNSDISGYHLP